MLLNLKSWCKTRQNPSKGTFTASYPYFATPSQFYRAVNARLRESCEKERAECLSEFPTQEGGPDWEGRQDIQVVYCDENMVSASVSWSEPGGAHGNSGCFGLNFIAHDGHAKKLRLEDLFLPGTGWEKILSDFCLAELRLQGASSVTNGRIKGFSPDKLVFTVSAAGLQIYFSPYDAASYAEGFFEVDIPWYVMQIQNRFDLSRFSNEK